MLEDLKRFREMTQNVITAQNRLLNMLDFCIEQSAELEQLKAQRIETNEFLRAHLERSSLSVVPIWGKYGASWSDAPVLTVMIEQQPMTTSQQIAQWREQTKGE